jgi:hypothetical protein
MLAKQGGHGWLPMAAVAVLQSFHKLKSILHFVDSIRAGHSPGVHTEASSIMRSMTWIFSSQVRRTYFSATAASSA